MTNGKEYLYVIDYSDASISEIPIHTGDIEDEDLEKFLKDKGFNTDEVYFMWSTHQIEIIKYD